MEKGLQAIDAKLGTRLNRVGEAVVKSIRRSPEDKPAKSKEEFRPDRPGRTLVLDDHGLDSLTMPIHEDERFIGLEFLHDKRKVIIPAENVDRLKEVVEQLWALPELKSTVSWGTLWGEATEWVKERYRERTDVGLVEHILQRSKEAVQDFQSCVPILHLSVETPIRIGPTTIIPLDSEFFDRMDLKLSQNIYAETSDVEKFVERNRSRFQGFSAATLNKRGDKETANQFGSLAAQWAVDCLLFFSPAMLDPTKTPKVEVFNLTPGPGMCSFLFKDGEVVSSGETMVGPDRYGWVISNKECVKLEEEVTPVASLLFKEAETPFRQEVLQAFRWYLKMPKAELLYQKLVYAMMAIETLLHKNRRERIKKMGPRFASILSSTDAEYQELIKFGKEIYDVRSRLLHHGQDVKDTEAVGRFLKLVRRFMLHVLDVSDQFETKKEFLDSIKIREVPED